MDVQEVVDRFRDAVNVRRVYGEPIQQDGITIVPAARLAGGGGGGAGGEGVQQGSGSGFGLGAKPAGAFVFRGGKVRWIPAVDVNRVILGAQTVGAIALLTVGRRLASRPRRRRGLLGRRRRSLWRALRG